MPAHKENAQRTLSTLDSKAVAMKVGIYLGVRNNPPAVLLHCKCTTRPVIPHPNPASTYNKERTAKPSENGVKWLKMRENRWQFKCATSIMHKKRKKTCYGTANL